LEALRIARRCRRKSMSIPLNRPIDAESIRLEPPSHNNRDRLRQTEAFADSSAGEPVLEVRRPRYGVRQQIAGRRVLARENASVEQHVLHGEVVSHRSSVVSGPRFGTGIPPRVARFISSMPWLTLGRAFTPDSTAQRQKTRVRKRRGQAPRENPKLRDMGLLSLSKEDLPQTHLELEDSRPATPGSNESRIGMVDSRVLASENPAKIWFIPARNQREGHANVFTL